MTHVEQVHPRIYRIHVPFERTGAVQLYVLRGAQVALVDSGVNTSPEAFVTPALDRIGLRLGDVDLVVNSHGHMDHLGGNAALVEAGARVLLHPADAPLASAQESHRALGDPLRYLGLPELAEELTGNMIRLLGAPTPVARWLDEGDEIDLGEGVVLRVIHTPGHAPGHIALYWEREGVLIAADAVQVWGSRPGGYPLYWDARAYRASLDRLAGLDVNLLLMGHWFRGPWAVPSPVRDRATAREAIEESRAVSAAIEEAVQAALQQSPEGSPLEIARAAVQALAYRMPTLLDRRSGLPGNGAISLASHIRQARSGA